MTYVTALADTPATSAQSRMGAKPTADEASALTTSFVVTTATTFPRAPFTKFHTVRKLVVSMTGAPTAKCNTRRRPPYLSLVCLSAAGELSTDQMRNIVLPSSVLLTSSPSLCPLNIPAQRFSQNRCTRSFSKTRLSATLNVQDVCVKSCDCHSETSSFVCAPSRIRSSDSLYTDWPAWRWMRRKRKTFRMLWNSRPPKFTSTAPLPLCNAAWCSSVFSAATATGGSWPKSPARTTLRPPKATFHPQQQEPPMQCWGWYTSRRHCCKRSWIWARTALEIMETSSITKRPTFPSSSVMTPKSSLDSGCNTPAGLALFSRNSETKVRPPAPKLLAATPV